MGFRDSIIGHEFQKMVLRKSFQSERLSNAYLFVGESGIGKGLLAKEFIKLIFCEAPLKDDTGPDSCGRCLQCRKIDHGSHPDLMIIEPDGQEIKIEQVRESQEFLSIRPVEAKRKALLVNDAETMNLYSQNAFLKTLEEPPGSSIIILITENPERLLTTVRSRCFQLRFGLLNRAQCEMVIKRILNSESDERIKKLARVCMGRPGLVLSDELSWDPDLVVETLHSGTLVPEKKDRDLLYSVMELYEVVLRDLVVQKISSNSDLYIFQEVSGVPISKKVSWKDIIKIYMKMLWLREMYVFNPNAALISNFLRTQFELLYEHS